MPSTGAPAEALPGGGAAATLAEIALPILRACGAIAEESLEQVAPSVTLQQFRALTVLHEHGPTNAAALADALGIARSTLTRLANRLVRDGLIDRVTDPADRRALVLSASRRGNRTAERVKTWRLQELARRFGDVSPEEGAALADALRRAGSFLAPEEGV
jgi:DNA-binding MarR family transcriptional regulator